LENIEDRHAFKSDEKKEESNTHNSTGNKEELNDNNISPIKAIDSTENHSVNAEKSPEKEIPSEAAPVTPVKPERPLPKYGIPSWDKDCLISLQRQQNRVRRK
jgi:hypothetical protein